MTVEKSTMRSSDFGVLEVGQFFCPVDPVMHPDAAKTHEQSGQWAQHVGVVRTSAELDRWLASTSADFYGGMVPHADPDRFQVAANWVYWGFSFDDTRCDEVRASREATGLLPVAQRVLRVLETEDEQVADNDRHLGALCDLARSYRRLGTAVQTERWIHAHRRWLFAAATQRALRSAAGKVGVDDYFRTRLHDAGGPPTQAMFEFANAAEVPGAEMDSPRVRAVTELFWMIPALDNDLVSRHKEILGHQDDYNVVSILSTAYGIDEEEAVSMATAWRDRMMVLFLRLREQIAAGKASAALRIYLDSLGHGIRANIDWSLRTPRYNTLYQQDGVTPSKHLELCGSFRETPTDSSCAPLPVPSLAWWWSQLD
ncbi:terpene synthase family protein [Streptomyces sp. NRRL B-1347]|uniref:terpene synthase family protein n=1 Tax=Streptomyces sp. NRRL B-1347 TaxID=1476877 RepID=UPI00131D6E20|nr:hypothetical protein [Streptomyces sp. NRRL B-1347]